MRTTVELNGQQITLILEWIGKALKDPYLDHTTMAVIDDLQTQIDKALDEKLDE